MTGYGRRRDGGGPCLYRGIRSVNNRYLDCGVKLPRSYSFAEDPVKKAPQGRRYPGQGRCLRDRHGADGRADADLPEPAVLEGLSGRTAAGLSDYDVKDDISVSTLARFSDIFLVEKADADERR